MRAKLALRTSKTWGLRHAFATIGPGEGVGLIGATGSGKTTLLRAFAGVMPADEGEIGSEAGSPRCCRLTPGCSPT